VAGRGKIYYIGGENVHLENWEGNRKMASLEGVL
jgi:hypothetical protein